MQTKFSRQKQLCEVLCTTEHISKIGRLVSLRLLPIFRESLATLTVNIGSQILTYLLFLFEVYESPSLLCTSKITLLAAFIATLVFQTSLIAFCCSCVFFWKIRPSNRKHIHQEKLASYYARRQYPGSWSLSTS